MSGKRAKSFRKKYSLSKKAKALCAGLLFTCAPLAAENEFLVSAFVPIAKPFGPVVEMKYGFGGGLRLTYRTAKVINIFAQGEYLSMALPAGVEPITLWDASLGAGYHFILTDRSSLDLNAFGGSYATVACRLLHGGHIFAYIRPHTDERVSQVVYPHVWQLCIFKRPFKRFADIIYWTSYITNTWEYIFAT